MQLYKCNRLNCYFCVYLIEYAVCKRKNKIMCRYPCVKQDCFNCYFASLCSHPMSNYWHLISNDMWIPRMIPLKSGKSYWFTCNKCNHDIYKRLICVTKYGGWCKYCAKQDLCEVFDCKICYDRSLATHSKAPYLCRELNKDGDRYLTPRDIAIRSGVKYFFICDICDHLLFISPDEMANGCWCCYCSHHQLCKETDCDMCYDNSFATSERAFFWHKTKNIPIVPRDVHPRSSHKFWFTCEIIIKGVRCGYDFESSLSNISAGKWCPKCQHCKREREIRIYIEHKLGMTGLSIMA